MRHERFHDPHDRLRAIAAARLSIAPNPLLNQIHDAASNRHHRPATSRSDCSSRERRFKTIIQLELRLRRINWKKEKGRPYNSILRIEIDLRQTVGDPYGLHIPRDVGHDGNTIFWLAEDHGKPIAIGATLKTEDFGFTEVAASQEGAGQCLCFRFLPPGH